MLGYTLNMDAKNTKELVKSAEPKDRMKVAAVAQMVENMSADAVFSLSSFLTCIETDPEKVYGGVPDLTQYFIDALEDYQLQQLLVMNWSWIISHGNRKGDMVAAADDMMEKMFSDIMRGNRDNSDIGKARFKEVFGFDVEDN